MVFSYNWLQSFFKKRLPPPKKLGELLTLHFAQVEEIKRAGKDFTLNIDIRPNRAGDCFSHLGVAREISAITGLIYRSPTPIIREKSLKAKDFINIEVKEKNACQRYTARVITDVKVGSSPKWIKDRLKVCGLSPINNIVDIANYVMLETGQPLHAFDGEKLENPEGKQASYGAGKKIIVRFAKNGEKIVTLDEQKFDLDSDILVIADEKKPVGIAGIKGEKFSGINKKTKIVVLESANFNSQIIRRGSRKLNLKTDASLRFEHGIDPNLTETAINQVAYLIQEIAKGKVDKGLVDFYPQKVLAKRIRLDLGYVDKLLGIKIPEREIRKILGSLGLKIKNWKLKIIEVEVPTLRLDVSLPEDLIEEISRIYGYDKIPSVFPVAALIPPKRNLDIFWEDAAKDILKEAGFTEVYNYSFISEKDKNIFGSENLIELENPISEDFKYLRPSLIPNLLKNIQKNQKRFAKIKIFEIGKTFRKIGENLEEKRILTGLMTEGDFFQLKGIIDILLNKLGISNVWFVEPSAHLTPHPAKRGSAYDEYQPTPEKSKLSIWNQKKCAEIKIDGEEIGFLGEIASKLWEELKIFQPVIVFDINFEKLQKLCSEEQEYRPISRYPAAIRDISVLVPRGILVEEVLNKIETAGGPLIRDIDLFDIYEGEEIPEGKKNLSFHIIFQAEDRTLSSAEIDEIQNNIIKVLEEDPEWQVRR